MKIKISAILLAALFIFPGITLTAGEKEEMIKVRELYKDGKLEAALELVNKTAKSYPESDTWPNAGYNILMELKRYEEAVKAAKLRYKLTKAKSPGKCLNVARAYLKLENKDGALKWIEEAVNIGYKKFYVFSEDAEWALVKDHPKITELVVRMKKNIGFGKAPEDFTVTTLSGQPFTLSRQKGKVVLIDFWATWCGPCVDEIPNIRNVYTKFKDKGFEIIGVSVDYSKDKLDKFIKKENIDWPVSYSGDGWKDKTKTAYGVTSIPSAWLVDKKGILRHFDLRGDDLGKAVEKLLAE